MTSTGLTTDAATRSGRRAALAVLPVFAVTIFTSAFLLFAVQPMFAKMVLPRLGGSPSVWSVAMCFFQAALLAGYAYAHLITRRLPFKVAMTVHGIVAVAAFAGLPIAIATGWDAPPLEGTALWLVGLFAISIGLPFFAVAANSPLLQAWFARTGHPQADDPYFLYGASNIGSLAALLLYPVVIEPFLSLDLQSAAWTAGYVVLVVLVAGCALLTLGSSGVRPIPAAAAADHGMAPTWRRKAGWMACAFVPSALMVALTAHISTDVAAAPFLWVVPLALFLLTFVITFARRPVVPHGLMLGLQPIFVALLALTAIWGQGDAWAPFLALNLLGFFIVAMVCHGELVRQRPAAEYLTGFYLWMSLGGVLGGIFASLIAPHVFSTVLEYPLLLVASLLVRPGAAQDGTRRLALYLAVAVAVFAGLVLPREAFGFVVTAAFPDLFLAAVVLLATWIAVEKRRPALGFALILAIAAAALTLDDDGRIVDTRRGFFGVHKVAMSEDGRFRLLLHGTTLHGAQRLFEPDGSVATSLDPLTYYYSDGPFVDAIKAVRASSGLNRVAVVGLGTGSLACWRSPGEDWRFYEIDPLVAAIARDPDYFRFLPDCGPDMPVVLGDARLTLAAEPDGSLDLLIVDAFSSDAIPVHLMTREAVAMYLDKLAPGGALVFHISNRNMDLAPVVAAVADSFGLEALVRPPDLDEALTDHYRSPALVAALAADPAALEGLSRSGRWQELAAQPGVDAWTDDYSNVPAAIWRAFAKRW